MRPFIDVTTRVQEPFMRRAAALALRAQGATAPNPLVGCVVVSDGLVVGEGYHPRAGEPHAEVFALADAGPRARGAHVYVTLEPCSHHGRTPPCTDALIAAGVERVSIGMADPSSEAGGGADILRSAGIDVDFSPDPDPFAELNRGWLKRVAHGVPWITVKAGVSLDARVAFEAGVRARITGPAGAEVTRELRARADAVLVGASTAAADDPALTVRASDGALAPHQPIRAVLAGSVMPGNDSALFTDDAAPTVVLAADTIGGTAGPPSSIDRLPSHIEVLRYPAVEGLRGALRALGRYGVNEVLVEPGPRLFTALWSERLLDELVTVTAGGMGGADAPSVYAGETDSSDGVGLSRLFMPVEAGIVGDVSVTVWRPDARVGES